MSQTALKQTHSLFLSRDHKKEADTREQVGNDECLYSQKDSKKTQTQALAEGTEAKQSSVLSLVDKWHGGIGLPHHHA